MIIAEDFAAKEGFACEAKRRKRLGQFFTGTGLGRLLAALAQAEKAQSIVDPMAGTGDLIAACLELGASPEAIGAIEIDRPHIASATNACLTLHASLGMLLTQQFLVAFRDKSGTLSSRTPLTCVIRACQKELEMRTNCPDPLMFVMGLSRLLSKCQHSMLKTKHCFSR